MKTGADIQREVESVLSQRRSAAIQRKAERFDEICSKIPEYGELSDGIKHLGIKLGRLALEGKRGSAESELLKKELKEKSSERINMLLRCGYTEDFLDDVYECPLCMDTGVVEKDGAGTNCSCYMSLYTERLRRESNISADEGFEAFNLAYYSKTPGKDGVSAYEKAADALAQARNFVEHFGTEQTNDMLFLGGAGVGKSYLCSCMACELLRRGVPVLYISAAEAFETLTYYGNDEAKNSKRELLENVLYSVELLVLDDLGAEKQSAARYGILIDLLNRRTDGKHNGRRTVISSNLLLKELNTVYDERIFSRLAAFDICEITGDDIRIIKKLKGV